MAPSASAPAAIADADGRVERRIALLGAGVKHHISDIQLIEQGVGRIRWPLIEQYGLPAETGRSTAGVAVDAGFEVDGAPVHPHRLHERPCDSLLRGVDRQLQHRTLGQGGQGLVHGPPFVLRNVDSRHRAADLGDHREDHDRNDHHTPSDAPIRRRTDSTAIATRGAAAR